MSQCFFTRACCVLLLLPVCGGAVADELALDDAVRLALDQQPQVQAQEQALRAARETAVAASQLPDPRINFGVSNLTITGPDRYTLRKETDTQFQLGVMQDFPRGAQRRLRGEQAGSEVELQAAELEKLRRVIGRDTALLWLDVWQAERAQALARDAAQQASLQAQAVEIGYRSGRGAQADVLAARVAQEVLNDRADALAQQAAHGRSQLSRWISSDAQRPLSPDLPETPPPAAFDALLAQLKQHPQLNASARRVQVAAGAVALAQQDYKSGWSVGVGYGYRPNFADYAQLQVSADLPWFTAQRQDRNLAARRAELERAEQLAQDDWREHAAELRLNYTDWQRLQPRFARYDTMILPAAMQRIDAARLAWQSGSGTLAQVLDARRAALEVQMQRLELAADNARHLTQLRYLAGDVHE